MLYRYWTLNLLTGAIVALALADIWFLRLKEDDVGERVPAESYTGESYTGQVTLPEIPEYLRNIPAERAVRSGR